MHKFVTFLVVLILAAGAVPLASVTPVAPASLAAAAADPCPHPIIVGNTVDCGDNGVTNGWHRITPPTSGGGSGPYCTSGLALWKWPRAADYPNPVKTARTSIIAEFDDQYFENESRAWQGYLNSSDHGAFYWSNALYDLAAMFMMINPLTGQLSAVSTSAQQINLFNGTIQRARTAVGKIVTVSVGPPKLGEFETSVSPAGADVATIGPADKDTFRSTPGKLTAAYIIASVNSHISSLERSGGSVDFYTYLSPNGVNFNGAQKYVKDALNASWVSDGKHGKYPYEVYANSGGNTSSQLVTAAMSNTVWPVGTTWYVQAVFPNRRPGISSFAELKADFDAIVNQQMTIKWTPGGANPVDGENDYYYPAFMAPSDNNHPEVCGTNKVTITPVPGVTFKFPGTAWTKGSWNGCKTVDMGSTSTYNSSPHPGAGNQSACWMAWLKRPLDPPKLPATSWSDATSGIVSPISFGPATQSVQIGDVPKALIALGGKPAAKSSNFSLNTPIGNTDFNLTEVGFTAELPGSCAQIFPGDNTVKQAGNSCILTETKAVPLRSPTLTLPPFTRTTLSRLQDSDCVAAAQSGGAKALQAACGIVYNQATKAWSYQITMYTWWDGMYQTVGLTVRSLFDPQYVKFPCSADPGKTRAWDSAFSVRGPDGAPAAWPNFGSNFPMYYAVMAGTDCNGDGTQVSSLPVYIIVTQNQPLGG